MSLFHLITGAIGTLDVLLQRSLHLLFALVLVFLTRPSSKKSKGGPSIMDALLVLASIASCGYVAINYWTITTRYVLSTPLSLWDALFGLLLILLVIEAARRALGPILATIPAIFLIYAWAGPWLPDILWHRGFTPLQIIDFMTLGFSGIWGLPIAVSSTYIVLFIILGTFLERSGAGQFIIDICNIIVGRSRGGPAKLAVLSSAAFGSISGSAVANVYGTGMFTIPMMKRIGYKPAFAGAVEAAASTGGQIMPPVMGAAAFIMAEIMGVPYIEVAKAAFLPAVLYFLSVGLMVHFEAVKRGLKGIPKEEVPKFKETIGYAYQIVPLVFLIALLVSGYSIFRAVFYSILVALFVSTFRKRSRMGPKAILSALIIAARRAASIAIACAASGLIIGTLLLTGVGFNFTTLVMQFSGQQPIIGLLLVMIACIILGTGLPTTVAYIIVAAIGVPALVNLGVPPMAAHMFAFYYAVISMVTPPDALSAYAGAEIAGADFLETAMIAMKLSVVAFLAPFMFAFSPQLLLIGPINEVLIAFITALIGTVALAAGVEGWLLTRANVVERILLVAAALGLIHYGLYTDLIGMGLFAAVFIIQMLKSKLSTYTVPAEGEILPSGALERIFRRALRGLRRPKDVAEEM
ncbi:MAG: TRAP transporter permease, partial [Candidatus Bathyarchaeia archaeon]